MKYHKKLVGEKCYLSPLSCDDVEIFTEWLNDLEVVKYLSLVRNPITQKKEKNILEEMALNHHAFAIIDKQLNKIVGVIGLENLDTINRATEMGVFLGDKGYWNKGYGEEAIRLMLDYAFNILNINNIMIEVIEYNERAINCYKKIGFREIGKRRGAYHIAGITYDVFFYDMIADEFVDSPYIKKIFSKEYEEASRAKTIELV